MKDVEKVVGAKGFDLGHLKKVAGLMNDSGLLEKKIDLKKKKGVIVENFIIAVEATAEENLKKIPEDAVKLYNAYSAIIDGETEEVFLNGAPVAEEGKVETDTPGKAESARKEEKPAKEKVPKKEVDKFEALKVKILSKKDTVLTAMVDALLLEGGSTGDIFAKAKSVAQAWGKVDYTSGGSLKIISHVKNRKAIGWQFEEKGDFVKLIGVK